jgi:hypothetical protein
MAAVDGELGVGSESGRDDEEAKREQNWIGAPLATPTHEGIKSEMYQTLHDDSLKHEEQLSFLAHL